MELYASSHTYTVFENLFFSLTLIGVFITQGFYFYSLFYSDTPNYRWFKIITVIVAVTLILLSIILINEPVEPQGAINNPICLIIGYGYILLIYFIALVNFFKIISNRQSKRKLRIFYSSLVILIFSLVASEINLPLGALVASIGVVICTWGYLIFLIPTKRKEPIIQAEAGQLIEKKRRFKSIDSIRGMGILLLVGFHIIIGLLKSPLEASEYFRDPFFAVFAIISTLASLFFIPAGASVLFSMNKRARKKVEPKKILIQQIKRGIFLILLGTVYDIFVYDFHWGIIDVLQITGLSIIIISLLYYPLIKNHYASSHEIKQKNMIDQSYKTLARTFSILALVVVLFSPIARMLFGYPVEDPNIDFFVSYSTPTNFIEYIQAWLTTSFYPIFPCLGFFFLGSAVGAIFLINRDKNQIIRKSFAKLIVILAILFQIAAVIISSIGGSLAGDLLLLPYNDQPKWVMEFTINAQPISTVLFFATFRHHIFIHRNPLLCTRYRTFGKDTSAIKYVYTKIKTPILGEDINSVFLRILNNLYSTISLGSYIKVL